MAREVYADKKFINYSKKHVFLRVMEDTSDEGHALARKFRIEGTPTLIILDSSGKEIDRIVGGRDVQELIDELEDILQSAKSEKYTI
jgi:thioredoxin-related protein